MVLMSILLFAVVYLKNLQFLCACKVVVCAVVIFILLLFPISYSLRSTLASLALDGLYIMVFLYFRFLITGALSSSLAMDMDQNRIVGLIHTC